MAADAGTLFVARHVRGETHLEPSAAYPETGEPRAAAPVPAEVQQAMRTGAAVLDPDGRGGAFPLTNHGGETVGVVALVRHDGGLSEAPRDLFVRFCRLAGAAVERADLLERIGADPATTDERLRDQVETLARIDVPDGMRGDDAFRLTISMLARAAEIYDEGTGNHVYRVNEYSHLLARTLGQDEKYCHRLRYSAQLHDVGKMSVSPAILRKSGDLTPDERREMDNHTVYGHRILSKSPRLDMAAEIALNHHEKWDGSGYPNGIAGEDIPLSARIVQMADIYDALRSRRAYKPAFDHARTREIILTGDERVDTAGHFDPRLVEAFAASEAEFARIWDEMTDG
ncbi:MAG: HD-GYP domain-containing protein [Alphaproteobacteria bacterium]|nr:HD-GYP domain-containing protein [Alphaproteobacteria bacterium]